MQKCDKKLVVQKIRKKMYKKIRFFNYFKHKKLLLSLLILLDN